jgi:hypothetical protein
VVKERVPALKSPLKSWSAGWLLDAIREHARKRREDAVWHEPPGVWIDQGTPKWEAWQAFRRSPAGGKKLGSSVRQHPDDKRRTGWNFPTEWPPGLGPHLEAGSTTTGVVR